MKRALGLSQCVWKRFILVGLGLVLSLAPLPTRAQSRLLVGTSGGQSFNNENIGIMAAIEIPFGHRYELDVRNVFSPIEKHVGLGSGMTNQFRAGGITWLNNRIGIAGAIEYSNYDVTHVSKGSYYSFGGPVFRVKFWDAPNRFELDYIREVGNSIYRGIETSHLQGVNIDWTVRVGCSGPMCFRVSEDFAIGHVLQQGNPVCDGTYGDGSQVGFLPCPRRGAIGGSFTASFTMEFRRGRRRDEDLDLF